MNVIFPIETIVRELDFRLLLAGLFARKRHRLFIAKTPSSYRLVEQMSGGLYVGKHLFPPMLLDKPPEAYLVAKKNRFRLIHLSEEGAVFKGDETSWKRYLDLQLNPQFLAEDDYICTWGDFQREHYLSRGPACASNLRTTGHPRFDLYRDAFRAIYEDEARAIRQKYGDFVLVNTNFSAAVNSMGPSYMFSPAIGYDVKNDTTRRWYVQLWRRISRTMPLYVELVHELSIRRPDMTIVIRPHPTEHVPFYADAFKGVPNVKVVREGTVTPWLLACRAMVHEGCTTAVEAHMLDRPIVMFDPEPDTEHQSYLPNIFGKRTSTLEDAVEAISEAFDSKKPAKEDDLPLRARQLLLNLTKESFPLLLDVMREAEERLNGTAMKGPSTWQVKRDELREDGIERAKRVVRPLFPYRKASAIEAYGRFPGFSRREIGRRVEIVRRLTGNPIDVTWHSPNLLEVTTPTA